MIEKNWTAVIPAAGKSKRFNYKQSKIFYKYKKKFLIEHSVDKIKIGHSYERVMPGKNYWCTE